MCKCHGIVKIVLGLLLLLNAFIWPRWNDLTGWIAWVAILMILMGIVKMFVPCCEGHGCSCEAPAKKKK